MVVTTVNPVFTPGMPSHKILGYQAGKYEKYLNVCGT
jgi:hypothetical protein